MSSYYAVQVLWSTMIEGFSGSSRATTLIRLLVPLFGRMISTSGSGHDFPVPSTNAQSRSRRRTRVDAPGARVRGTVVFPEPCSVVRFFVCVMV